MTFEDKKKRLAESMRRFDEAVRLRAQMYAIYKPYEELFVMADRSGFKVKAVRMRRSDLERYRELNNQLATMYGNPPVRSDWAVTLYGVPVFEIA